MNMITIEVSEAHAELLLNQMRNRRKAMDNTLNSFRSNNLTDTDAYRRLEAEKSDLQAGIQYIEEELEEEEEETDSLGDLFG